MPAPLWRRVSAFGIDALAMLLTMILVALFIAIMITVAGGSVRAADTTKALPFLVWLGYYGRGQWLRRETLGERAMRIALISCSGAAQPGLARIAARALLAPLLFWTLPLACCSGLRQTPYDWLSGVRVVLLQPGIQGVSWKNSRN